MFTITTKKDAITWNSYRKEVNDWKYGFEIRNKFHKAKDWNGYEAMGREIEDRWRIIFNDIVKQQQVDQKLQEEVSRRTVRSDKRRRVRTRSELDAASALIQISNNNSDVKQPPRRSTRIKRITSL